MESNKYPQAKGTPLCQEKEAAPILDMADFRFRYLYIPTRGGGANHEIRTSDSPFEHINRHSKKRKVLPFECPILVG